MSTMYVNGVYAKVGDSVVVIDLTRERSYFKLYKEYKVSKVLDEDTFLKLSNGFFIPSEQVIRVDHYPKYKEDYREMRVIRN